MITLDRGAYDRTSVTGRIWFGELDIALDAIAMVAPHETQAGGQPTTLVLLTGGDEIYTHESVASIRLKIAEARETDHKRKGSDVFARAKQFAALAQGLIGAYGETKTQTQPVVMPGDDDVEDDGLPE